MEKSLFEQNGGTYRQVGDYLLPNITLPEEETVHIGIWGRRHKLYLKQNHRVLYMNLLTSGKLNILVLSNNVQSVYTQKICKSVKLINFDFLPVVCMPPEAALFC